MGICRLPTSNRALLISQATRRDQWKAVRYEKEARVERYNIEKAPSESEELSKQFPKSKGQGLNSERNPRPIPRDRVLIRGTH